MSILYQPKRSFLHGCIVGFSAQMAKPSINTSEQVSQGATQLVIGDDPFAQFVAEVLSQLAKWQRTSFCKIPTSINIPWNKLEDCSFLPMVCTLCDELSLPRSLVEFSISSNPHSGKHFEAISECLKMLDLGYRVATDHYSLDSMSPSFAQHSFSSIEIKNSLTNNLETLQSAKDNVVGIIARCNELNFPVTVEGVDTPQQYFWLANAGCSVGQGSYFGSPQEAGALLRMELWFWQNGTNSWKVHKGRFIPTNPRYFRPRFS